MNLKKLHKYRVDYFITSVTLKIVLKEKRGYPITINGHVFFIGYIRDKGCTGWRVTDRNTGLWLKKDMSSAEEAINVAVDAFKTEGEDKYRRVIAILIKENTILMHPKLLVQRYSDYTPILEFTICNEEENE